jgi:hypothetical protein
MILKFSRGKEGNTNWTFIDGITFINVDKDPLQDKDDNFTCKIQCFHKEEERLPVYFVKGDAVYLLNDDGKTIECLN